MNLMYHQNGIAMVCFTTNPIRAYLLLFFSFIIIGLPLFSQESFKVRLPGTSFSIERSDKQASFTDVAGGGRQFQAKAFATVSLKAFIIVPPPTKAESKLIELTVHFHSTSTGPSLRGIEVLNGTAIEFQKQTNIKGDYTAITNNKSEFTANSWLIHGFVNVTPRSVVRLKIMFPGGFDSPVNPGVFTLTGVEVGFPLKNKDFTRKKTDIVGVSPGRGLDRIVQPLPLPIQIPGATKAVVYGVSENGDLSWYNHLGAGNGSMTWEGPRKVGSGWNFKEVFSGGGDVIYAIKTDGELLWYQHTGQRDGSVKWQGPKSVGTGWNFKNVF